MRGLEYRGSGNAVQDSFSYVSHENLAITATASTSNPIGDYQVMLSLLVGAHVKLGSGDATTSDMVMPSGIWPLVVEKGDTVSVLQLTGGDAGQASLIQVER